MNTALHRATRPLISIRPIRAAEFRSFQSLVHRTTGISLSLAKKELLVARLSRRLRARGLSSFSAYYDLVLDDETELQSMLDAISTNETDFFREPLQFDYLETVVIPTWKAAAAAKQRRSQIRVWSAGCSSGEEPYSIAMVLLYHLPGWNIEVLATDLSSRVLERAASGVWPVEEAKKIPHHYLKRFMFRGTRGQQGKMKAGPEVTSVVKVRRLNFVTDEFPGGPAFDLIFCRNVLIYFDTKGRDRVVRRLLERLDPAGYFFLGHAESLNGMRNEVRPVAPTIYQLAKEKTATQALRLMP